MYGATFLFKTFRFSSGHRMSTFKISQGHCSREIPLINMLHGERNLHVTANHDFKALEKFGHPTLHKKDGKGANGVRRLWKAYYNIAKDNVLVCLPVRYTLFLFFIFKAERKHKYFHNFISPPMEEHSRLLPARFPC